LESGSTPTHSTRPIGIESRKRIPSGLTIRQPWIAALKQIRASFRQPLLLCDVDAVKYQDIAAILDIPVEIVMSRISIARDTISQILQLQFGELQ
jgi:DNA-directed RNA polymerase specialized sigma24 family protein